jgi:2'-5' RNA ligase
VARDRASRPEATPLRLFVAADIPSTVRDRLADAAATLREDLPGGRWVPPENWHVTLKFLGSTWPRLVEWVEEACARVASEHAPIETRLSGLGAFPGGRRARVLWAGLDDQAGRLAAVAAGLEREVAREFRPEKRPFAAHLTIARFDPPVPVEGALGELQVESETFTIDRLVLYRSHLQRPAPRYEPLREFSLDS